MSSISYNFDKCNNISNIIGKIIDKSNDLETNINNLQTNTNILTDSFCVIGGSTIIGEDDSENPIFGSGKSLSYSYDGINFNPSLTSNVLSNVRNIDFNGYQWIATGESSNYTQSLVLSSDGINWITPVNNVLPYYISSIAWGKKKWCAVGKVTEYATPKVAYSYDGMNWTLATYNSSSFPNSIASNGSMFVVAAAKYIGYSTDGITWLETNVESTLGTNVFVNGVVWGGNIWVVSYGNVGYALGWSEDGITWNQANTAGIMNSGIGVAYNGTIFFAWGVGWSNCATSKNGKNWTGVTIPNDFFNAGMGIKDVTWNGTYWVIVGSVNNVTENKVAYTKDFITWNVSTSGNNLYSQVQVMGAVTSRNRKNYYIPLNS